MNLSSISRINGLKDRCWRGNRNTWMVSCLAKFNEIWATCWHSPRIDAHCARIDRTHYPFRLLMHARRLLSKWKRTVSNWEDLPVADASSGWICEWNGLLRELCWLQEADLSPRMTTIHCAEAAEPSHSTTPFNTKPRGLL
jgi:hypothetical protein